MNKFLENYNLRPGRLLIAAMSVYAAFFTFITFKKYDLFVYSDYDFACYAQMFWSLLRGESFLTIIEMNPWGNHLTPIVVLLLPVYALFQHPKTILFIQNAFLAFGAFPVFLFSRIYFSKGKALAFSLAYLLYPALAGLNLFEFHPNALAVPFLLFALYFFDKQKFGKFMLFSVVAVLCQENIALAIVVFAILALFLKRGFKWVFAPLIFGIAYFLIALLFILPKFNNGNVDFLTIYSHLGRSISDIVRNIFFDPLKVLRFILVKQNFILFIHLFAPLCFLPLFGLKYLLLASPFFAQHLLSLRYSEHTIYFQYMAEIIPFVFAAAILGMKKLEDRSPVLTKKLFFSMVFLSLLFNILLFSDSYKRVFLYNEDEVMLKERFVKMVDPQAPVMATFEFLPRFSQRRIVHSFHFAYSGNYTLTQKEYRYPSLLEFCLVDLNDTLTFSGFEHAGSSENFRNLVSHYNFKAVDFVDSLVLFSRERESGLQLYKILPYIDNAHSIDLGTTLKFLGSEVRPKVVSTGDVIDVSLSFQPARRINSNYEFLFFFIQNDAPKAVKKLYPCHKLYPTSEWKEREIVWSQYRVLVPRGLKGNYELKLYVYDPISGSALSYKDSVGNLQKAIPISFLNVNSR